MAAGDLVKDRKNRTERVRKRKKSLIKKADELARISGADVALIIRKNGRYWTYRSINQDSWPPAMEQIVSGCW